MDFADLLRKHEIDPTSCLAMRHTPPEKDFGRDFPKMIAQEFDLFVAYQSTQKIRVESELRQVDTVASFVGLKRPARTAFVGVFRIVGERTVSPSELLDMPAQKELRRRGMDISGYTGPRDLFELEEVSEFREWKGRLFVDWPMPWIKWTRLVSEAAFPVTEEKVSYFDSLA